MNNPFSLVGKVAVVTGATGLLGTEFCKALSHAGANVVVADIESTRCDELAESLTNEALGLRMDVTDVASLMSARQDIIDCFGRIDILVNNAAINDMVENSEALRELSRFENYPVSLWNRVMNVNITGMFLCSQIIGHSMLEHGGSIINIASTYGIVAPDQSIYHDGVEQQFYKSPVYPASKGAVLGFTRYLAAYWAKQRIRVNALSPGGIENHQDEYFIKNYSQRVPMGRMATTADYEGAIVFLASDSSSYMTGTNLVVDGGWSAI